MATSTANAAEERAEPSEEALSYWDEGESRPFVSALGSLGAVSALTVAGGYGKPHWTWGGVEVTGLSTFEFAMLSVGPRLALVLGDLTLKRRWTWAYVHRFLAAQPSYDADDLEVQRGTPARYEAWDLDLWGVFPLPHGFGQYDFGGTYVSGVPSDGTVFEEYNRIVMPNGWLWYARFGLGALLIDDRLGAGVLGELLVVPDRDNTWRLGPSLSFQATDHLCLLAVYTVPLSSPDELGAWLGAWGTLEARYAWASGEPRPAFP